MTKSKFPKAFAAVGLATVLVGCGSGSSSITIDPTPTVDPTPTMDETASMTAEDSLKAALATFERRVNDLNNYSTDRQENLARASLETVGKLLEDTSIPQDAQAAYEDRYRNIEIELNNRVETKKKHMDDNRLATMLITAFDAWDNNNMNGIDLMLDGNSSGFRSPMYSDVMEQNGSTKISAFDISENEIMIDLVTPIEYELPDGWEGMSFMSGSNTEGRYLKIFTDHMEPSETYAGKWEDFWGTTNNLASDSTATTNNRATVAGTAPNMVTANGPGVPQYFAEGYYAHAFGESNVDILRGASNPTVSGVEAMEMIRIMEGGPSAIHYTDLNIGEGLLTEPLQIGLNDDTLPSLVTLFGRPVTLGCTVTVAATPAENVSNGGGCQVDISSEGFLEVKHIALNADGTADEREGDARTTADAIVNDEANVARLTLTTTEGRTGLKDVEIDITRPDTDYKVMGYWIDKHGTAADAFNIDTFATARYGPAGTTGITDNIGRLEGEATYTGDSFGAYVMNKGDGDNMDLYDGEFKATVTLNANFMETNRRNNDNAFTLEGAIENFESLTSTDDDLTAWTLDLNMSTVNNSTGSFRGTTTGEGNWQGQFYGKDGMDTADEEGDDLPLAAVGDFSGDFGNYNRVVGVFGADKMEE